MHMCHLRTTYDKDLAQTANKGYWRDFGIFRVFSILAHAAGVFLVGILFVFEVDIQQVIFLCRISVKIMPELLENPHVQRKRFSNPG